MSTATSSDKIRVLLVEDEPLVAMMMADLIEEAGFHVVGPATNLQNILQLMEADPPPAVAIIDVTLNGAREGVQVAAELSRRYDLPLIFISGHSDVEQWPEVQALRPIAVLQKPCLPEQVEEALMAATTAKERRRSSSTEGSPVSGELRPAGVAPVKGGN